MNRLMIPLFIFLISCNSLNNDESGLFKFKNDKNISDEFGEPRDKNTYYFPFEAFRDSSRKEKWEASMDTFDIKYFSETLHAMKEPILTNEYLGKEIYRVTLLRSFDPDIVVRIEKTNDAVTLIEKTHFQYKRSIEDSIIQAKNGMPPIHCMHTVIDSTTVTQDKKRISKENWLRFENIVRTKKFESMPTTVKMDFGPDGDVWLLEKHSKQGYYLVKRSSYGKGVDSLRTICDSLIQMSDLRHND